jgi:hypothetical protein
MHDSYRLIISGDSTINYSIGDKVKTKSHPYPAAEQYRTPHRFFMRN